MAHPSRPQVPLNHIVEGRACRVVNIQQNRAKAAEELAAAKLAEERSVQRNVKAAVLLTVETCTKFYLKDAESAILNPVCNKLFLETGLPD